MNTNQIIGTDSNQPRKKIWQQIIEGFQLVKNIFKNDTENGVEKGTRVQLFWLAIFTISIVIFLGKYLTCNKSSGIVTFLLVAAACSLGGAAIGFLFGLPRAEKYRFINKDDIDHNSKDYSYGDNSNLEEVSDWITKIIIGLTLIKLNTIIRWIDLSAHSFEKAFTEGCTTSQSPLHAFVFGYCTIIFYFLAGAGICYLWARTNLAVIFTRSKKKQLDENKKLVVALQKAVNPNLNQNMNTPVQATEQTKIIEEKIVSISKDLDLSVDDPATSNFQTASSNDLDTVSTDSFKNLIENIYNSKSIFDKTDIQKGRWGGKARVGDFILEAKYISNSLIPSVFNIQINVRSLNSTNPIKGNVAFFIHDSFPSEIVFEMAKNNLASISLSAYEAFVVGARLENGIELELDLNIDKSIFPSDFYW